MFGAYDYLGLALDAAVTAYLIKLHRKDCKTIDNIKKAPSLDVGSDLVSLVETHPDQKLPYAVVRGRVTAINDTVESSTGEKGVIRIVSFHEITNNSFREFRYNESVPPFNEIKNQVPFALKSMSTSSGNVTVQVDNPFEGIWESFLLKCSSSFTPKNSSISSSLMGGITNAKVLGVRKTEKFLPLGTIVTGIGEIVKDPKTGALMLQTPSDGTRLYPYVLTTLSIEDLLSKLEFRRNVQRLIIFMSASVGLVLLGRKVAGLWKYFKMRRLRDSIVQERMNRNLDELCRCQTCLACLINPREVILLECGHVCVCADCVLKVNGQCPVCRERISSTIKAFIP